LGPIPNPQSPIPNPQTFSKIYPIMLINYLCFLIYRLYKYK
jgi:hypothetical protein